MPPSPPTVRTVTPRWVLALVAAAYLPLLGLLVVLALQLQDTRTTVDGPVAGQQREIRDATLPLADAVTPAARAALADRPAARRLTARSLEMAEQLTPLARDLRASAAGRQLERVGALAADLSARDAGAQLARTGALAESLLAADAGTQLRRSGQLAATLLGADVGGALRDVRSLASLLQNADVAETARSLSETTDELNRGTRLGRLMTRLTAVVGQAQQERFVRRTTTAADAVVRRIVPMLETLVRLQTESLEVTRDTNRRAASLDRKLGGELPQP